MPNSVCGRFPTLEASLQYTEATSETDVALLHITDPSGLKERGAVRAEHLGPQCLVDAKALLTCTQVRTALCLARNNKIS